MDCIVCTLWVPSGMQPPKHADRVLLLSLTTAGHEGIIRGPQVPKRLCGVEWREFGTMLIEPDISRKPQAKSTGHTHRRTHSPAWFKGQQATGNTPGSTSSGAQVRSLLSALRQARQDAAQSIFWRSAMNKACCGGGLLGGSVECERT